MITSCKNAQCSLRFPNRRHIFETRWRRRISKCWKGREHVIMRIAAIMQGETQTWRKFIGRWSCKERCVEATRNELDSSMRRCKRACDCSSTWCTAPKHGGSSEDFAFFFCQSFALCPRCCMWESQNRVSWWPKISHSIVLMTLPGNEPIWFITLRGIVRGKVTSLASSCFISSMEAAAAQRVTEKHKGPVSRAQGLLRVA